MRTLNTKALIIIALFAISLSSYAFDGLKYSKIQSGIEFSVNGIKKRISFYDENIVRVSLIKDGHEFKDSSLDVVLKAKTVKFSIKENTRLILKTNLLTLEIDKNSGVICFLNPTNQVYLKEHDEILPSLTDTTIQNLTYYKIKQAFKLTKKEGLYGLGQFQDGLMNYRNKDLLLVQANKIAIVPFLVSTNNYGILWENYSHSTFHDGIDDTYFTSKVADQIDYYFIGGKNIDDVISGYRTLTGQAPMFSKKAFGFWQSKERYTSFTELHEVVKKYRENNIPIDNIVQDWRYWGNNDKWSSMYFDPEFYANPSENIQKLHSNHIDLMVSIWPSLGPNTQIFNDMRLNGFLFDQEHWCGGKVYDAYNPKAREIYWNYIKEGLAKNGVDGYWMDGTEPEFSNTNDQEITENEILKVKTTAAGPIAKFLNTYSLVTCEGVYKGHREFTNDKRVFILTRSSWAGQQRYATVTWSGDIGASFDILKKQISAGINFCMAGVPYWTHDIGGFFPYGGGGLYPKGIEDPAYQELYVRWFQFGAFTPIFRSHGTGTSREVWQFKDRNPEFYKALLKTLRLRYRLLPYIYSNAWQVTNNNYTLMRGLVMDFPKDTNVWNIPDQYMFGPSIMVKPITKNTYYDIESLASQTPSDKINNLKKSKVEEIYLPKDKGWYDFWTNGFYKGGQTIKKEFSIDIFPLYIKAGSIIPFGPNQQYVDEKPNDPIEIRVYTGEDAGFIYYEDEGDNYNYEKGAYNTIAFKWNEKDKILKIGESVGHFKGFNKEKIFKVVIIEPSDVAKDGNNIKYKECKYIGNSMEIKIR